MAGYLGDEQPDLTDDGFLRTGDLGRETDDGFAFTARRGDALRLGGFLVSPREIEAFLEQGDDIAEAAVVAVEHEGAQRPVAFAVGDAVDEAARVERCRASLAAFKVPRRVLELGELPSTDSPNGRKVQRSELRRLAAEALQGTPRREESAMSAQHQQAQASRRPAEDRRAGAAPAETHDWRQIAETPEFQELH